MPEISEKSEGLPKWKKPFNVERGDVYMADLGGADDVVGSEQYGIRPVVITQQNSLNERSPTVMIAIITSEIKKEGLDTHVVLPMTKGLPKQSMVSAEQRFTIDKSRLQKYCCSLSEDIMRDITRACRKAEAPIGKTRFR